MINKKPSLFTGTMYDRFSEFERCFAVNLNVFESQNDKSTLPVYKSRNQYDDFLYVNIYQGHLSYITNIHQYCKKFQCQCCTKIFNTRKSSVRHQRSCINQTKFKYPGGFYTKSKTIFQELYENGIIVFHDEQFYPWFIVYDFEAILQKTNKKGSDKLTWNNQHIPISVSVCSNVPKYEEEKCFVETDCNILVERMVNYMTEISEKAKALA